jgi:PAS domain S-box-containing protein
MKNEMEAEGEDLVSKIESLENRLAEAEQLIEAIKAGEVDAFAIESNNKQEIYTLKSGDYAYRVLIEKFNEGALNFTEDGLIVYTNTYFCHLLGLPYEKVVGSYIFDFITNDSKDAFKNLFVQSFNGSSKGEVNLFIKGIATPVYVSLTSLFPTLSTIGMIVTDLSEKKSQEKRISGYQKELEEKNEQLLMQNQQLEQKEKSLADKNAKLQSQNAELASFSYMASHDLKEPLRKIQIFVNRIFQKDGDHLSPDSRDYFTRVTNVASRMQTLIDALLDYTQTETASTNLVATDLNIVFNDVKKDLQDEILDKNVRLESHDLPTIKADPLQLHQLFLNIISNSIKYRKRELSPVITISASKVPSSSIKTGEPTPKDKYWKICIADNGIGFDPAYELKIFETFQRLHGKSEYPGTGLGLAICKKIVQNHHGLITAESKPGQGATFNIYLP